MILIYFFHFREMNHFSMRQPNSTTPSNNNFTLDDSPNATNESGFNNLFNTTDIDESTIYRVFGALLAVIAVFAFIGNLIVILLFIFNRQIRISASYFILSLSLADFITAALVMTIEADVWLNDNNWRFGYVMCHVWTTIYLFIVPVSILTCCLSSIERWYAISRPLKYRANKSKITKMTNAGIIVVWIYSLLFSLIPKMGWKRIDISLYSSYNGKQSCIFDITTIYSILSSVLNFVLPSILTACLYYQMFRSMKIHTRTRQTMTSISVNSQRSLGRSLALIGSLLILTWCPFSILSISSNICLHLYCDRLVNYIDKLHSLWLTLLMLGYLNSAINPIVYALRFPQFRIAFKKGIAGIANIYN